MSYERQEFLNPESAHEALRDVISPLRLGTYMKHAGHDFNRALDLYIWNAQIGAAFHPPIQSFEVALRNRVSGGLKAAFGEHWWQNGEFLEMVESRRRDDINTVRTRLKHRKLRMETGQMVAGLSLGFWISMLHKRYNPTIWSQHLRSAFPYLPSEIILTTLHRRATEIADLRNRISHHEPIFFRDLLTDHGQCIEAIAWLCPTKAAWIKPHCHVPSLIRQKP